MADREDSECMEDKSPPKTRNSGSGSAKTTNQTSAEERTTRERDSESKTLNISRSGSGSDSENKHTSKQVMKATNSVFKTKMIRDSRQTNFSPRQTNSILKPHSLPRQTNSFRLPRDTRSKFSPKNYYGDSFLKTEMTCKNRLFSSSQTRSGEISSGRPLIGIHSCNRIKPPSNEQLRRASRRTRRSNAMKNVNSKCGEEKEKNCRRQLRSSVEKLVNASTSDSDMSDFVLLGPYQLDRTEPMSPHLWAYHRNNMNFILVAKIYNDKKFKPRNLFYFQMLRTLARRHANILGTYGVFHRDSTFFVFQEGVNCNNLEEFLQNHSNGLGEKVGLAISKQLYAAMSYLNDFAIAHRNICPESLLVFEKRETVVKLTEFQSAIIYWNPADEQVITMPCLPLSELEKQSEFCAPEIFSDNRSAEFHPVIADTWSFGACVCRIITNKCPSNVEVSICVFKTNLITDWLFRKVMDVLMRSWYRL